VQHAANTYNRTTALLPHRQSKLGLFNQGCLCVHQVWFADADGQGQGSWWKAQILIDNRPEQVGLPGVQLLPTTGCCQ
jgi:hypothetical protein